MESPEADPAYWTGEADFLAPLDSVSYAEGMLLGFEALRAEQAYHRRRLNRHRYWLHGDGTIAGLAVRLVHDHGALAEDRAHSIQVKVVVSPGIALDAFGRDVVVPEEQELVLNDWLKAQDAGALERARARPDGPLSLRVTLRHRPVSRGYQPVLARRLNQVTDAVDASRIEDGFALELLADEALLDPRSQPQLPWQRALPTVAQVEGKLTAQERQQWDLLKAGDPNAPARVEFERRVRRLHAFDADGALPDVTDPDLDDLAELSSILLARLSIEIAAAETIETLPVSPARMQVDNFVRRFAVPLAP